MNNEIFNLSDQAFSVSGFVAVLNQTLDYSFHTVQISGEISNYRLSKNKWVYFDLKDDQASLKCFGSIYQLPMPLQDGMTVVITGTPRLHPLYNFSITFQTISLRGEGTIKKAASLLEEKLRKEGLFDEERKRTIPYPPQHIGLITSSESAAYHDFEKILRQRWGGVYVTLVDVQVQGEAAPNQIVNAIAQLQQLPDLPDVIVIIRGGGSADDLQAFSTEQVTRAVATSRIPTVVAIGHEVDISLAELAADHRASTPSNAAEILVPDKQSELQKVQQRRALLSQSVERLLEDKQNLVKLQLGRIDNALQSLIHEAQRRLVLHSNILQAYNPTAALQRGYALVRAGQVHILSGKAVKPGDNLEIEIADATITTTVEQVIMKGNL